MIGQSGTVGAQSHPVAPHTPGTGGRLRVAVIAACPFPYPRGTPARILRSAEALADRGHDVQVVTYHLGDHDMATRLRIHRTPPVSTYRRLAPGPSYQKLLLVDPLLVWRLATVLRRTPFDVIHAHHFEALLVALAASGARRRIPIVFDAHTMLGSELHYYGLGMTKGWKQRIGTVLDRVLPRTADAVIAVSDNIHASIVRSLGDKIPVELIANGVEYEHFAIDGETARPGCLIYTGNLSGYQRIDLMLAGFRRVLDRRPDVRLQIVLNEPTGPLVSMIAEHGVGDAVTAVQAGFDELPRLLARAPIALNPRTECDGLPQKLLNYMASGRAIVSSAGSARHLRHEDTALIVPNDDVEAFAASVLTLLDRPDYARRLGDAARRQARTEFSWPSVAMRMEALYHRAIAAREQRHAAA